MNITLRQLEAFSRIEEFGSFVRAAQKMHLTQSALSHLIRELEQNLGFPLFRRTTRSVKLTPEGAAFLPYAARILTNVENAVECAHALNAGEKGVVRVATTPLLASSHLTSVISRYREVNPGIQIHIHEAIADECIQALADEKVDLAIGPQRATPKGIVAETLFSTRLSLLCSANHKYAKRKSIKWRDLEGEQLLLAKGGVRETVSADIDNLVSLEQATEIEHFTTLLALASIGKHVAIATEYIQAFLPVYKLKMVRIAQPVVQRKVMLYLMGDLPLSKGASDFVGFLNSSMTTASKA
ncbi:LysR family transcriptional regulator [Alcaligenaceae bacterium]|nr:LysR family transcriptional regulator [Alcaligenaceae bacterium]